MQTCIIWRLYSRNNYNQNNHTQFMVVSICPAARTSLLATSAVCCKVSFCAGAADRGLGAGGLRGEAGPGNLVMVKPIICQSKLKLWKGKYHSCLTIMGRRTSATAASVAIVRGSSVAVGWWRMVPVRGVTSGRGVAAGVVVVCRRRRVASRGRVTRHRGRGL